jgi:hypothetical protein
VLVRFVDCTQSGVGPAVYQARRRIESGERMSDTSKGKIFE